MKEIEKYATLIGEYTSKEPEWHELRKSGIGGSEIGTILGLNPYESAYTLWHKKMGLIDDAIQPNWSMRFGVAFEEPILKMFEEDHPELEIIRTGTWRSNTTDYQLANPDAIFRNRKTGEYGIIEVKTSRAVWDEIPPSYLAQVNWYLDTFKLQRAYLIGVTGWQWTETELFYNKFEAEVAKQMAKRFWESLQAQVRPDWDGSESTYETVRRRTQSESDGSIDIGELGIQLSEQQAVFDVAQEKLMRLKSEVLSTMGKNKYATVTLDNDVSSVVALKQQRGDGLPYLQIRKDKK